MENRQEAVDRRSDDRMQSSDPAQNLMTARKEGRASAEDSCSEDKEKSSDPGQQSMTATARVEDRAGAEDRNSEGEETSSDPARNTGSSHPLHKGAPIRDDDDARVQVLQSLDLLDSEPEGAFDRITEAAAATLKVCLCAAFASTVALSIPRPVWLCLVLAGCVHVQAGGSCCDGMHVACDGGGFVLTAVQRSVANSSQSHWCRWWIRIVSGSSLGLGSVSRRLTETSPCARTLCMQRAQNAWLCRIPGR